ncbi:MAG: H/ACA ribonucleoprotein complex subunit GAR1 [Haloarculaceae archaeon]
MRRVGTVDRVADGRLVVRSADESVPDIGSEVLSEDLATVGTVVDVFGPVDRPYLAVTPDDGVHPAALVGAPLYTR